MSVGCINTSECNQGILLARMITVLAFPHWPQMWSFELITQISCTNWGSKNKECSFVLLCAWWFVQFQTEVHYTSPTSLACPMVSVDGGRWMDSKAIRNVTAHYISAPNPTRIIDQFPWQFLCVQQTRTNNRGLQEKWVGTRHGIISEFLTHFEGQNFPSILLICN